MLVTDARFIVLYLGLKSSHLCSIWATQNTLMSLFSKHPVEWEIIIPYSLIGGWGTEIKWFTKVTVEALWQNQELHPYLSTPKPVP